MDALTQCLEFTLSWEGGFSNDAGDPGGKTKFGITEAVARGWGYKGDMRDLPKDVAVSIYRAQYWTPLALDAPAMQDLGLQKRLFDMAVNCGVSVSACRLQSSLNRINNQTKLWPDVMVDGHVGGATLSAVAEALKPANRRFLLLALDIVRADYYVERLVKADDTNERFVDGWMNRMVPLLKESALLA